MSENEQLDTAVGQTLLRIARRSLERYVRDRMIALPDLAELPAVAAQPGCSFVTLTDHGRLRGCIGSTTPRWSLAEDVVRHAGAAACDPRFAPVKPAELGDIRLEVTVLTPVQPFVYADYEALLRRLRPGIDGVVLTWQERRAVLLPQVWDRIPDPAQFLAILARKAGIPQRTLTAVPPTVGVLTFQVQHVAEPGYREPGS